MESKKNNYIFYIILFFLIFILIEISSYIFIKKLKTSDFVKGTKEYISSYINADYFKTDKLLFNPYVEHKNNLKFLSERPKIYLKKKPFKNIYYNNFNDLILIQGDSWAEIASTNKKILNILKQFGESNNYSIYNSGTSSYSLSLYISQLKILQTYYDIYPEYIILIIDQTDLGDDLYRRTYFDHLPSKISLNYNKKILNNIEGKNLNIIKIIKLPLLYISFVKENYNFNYFELVKFLKTKLISKVTKTPMILMPLKSGISKKQESYFYDLLDIYYNLANTKNLKKILLVTHPHRNHLNKKYKLDLNILINNYIKNNKSNSKLYYLDFGNMIDPEIKLENLFKKNDIFSHLDKLKYEDYFYPSIMNKFLDIK